MLKQRLKYPYVTLLALPYLIYYLPEFLQSPLFEISKLSGYISLFFLIDIAIIILSKKEILIWQIKIALWAICFYIFYGYLFSTQIQILIYTQFNLMIRGRFILLIISLSFLIFVIEKRPKSYLVINTFLIILILLNIFNIIFKSTSIKKYDKINLSYQSASKKNYKKFTKPIILIILDEYSSPSELYKITKDSALFDFTKNLQKNNWIVKLKSFSYETSTIHSLCSLFNYNLSTNNSFSKLTANSLSEFLLEPILIKELKANRIKVVNLGIFDLMSIKPLSRLYFYPQNFTELIFQYSSFYTIITKTNKLNLNSYKIDDYPMANHNKWMYDNLTDSLNKIKQYSFIYSHFYMPHAPFYFFNEFNSNHKNTTLKYIEYWKFTNKKLLPILRKLEGNYRIIITGDHGYRGNRNINPHLTYSSFYGFSSNDLAKIKSVQDLGIIIN